MKIEGYFVKSEPLVLHFEEDRMLEPPALNRLKARVQGQILFIGDYWLTVSEARALRDWITAALPVDGGGKP